jgi:hypothetical protein
VIEDPAAPEPPRYASTAAWRELLDGLRELDEHFLSGPKAVRDETAVAEGYRFLATILGVACDVKLFADSAAPRFSDINTPFRHDRRWGGDNTDAYYAFAPLDPTRTYRVSGRRGDSVYFSLTVYNEPSPGQWSNRIVGIVNDSDLRFDDDGTFEMYLGPRRPDGWTGAFIELSADASAAVTRDYQLFPHRGRRIDWQIEAIEPAPPTPATDAATAAALRTVLRWIREMFVVVPLTVAPRADRTTLGHNVPVGANTFAAPYQVGDANYGWSARDACYSFGSFALDADEALVITHRPPPCRFWNLVIWNQFMACHDVEHAPASINLGAATPNADGTVTVVVARDLLTHPNALSTVGHEEGVLAFRWFHPDAVPDQPVVELVHRERAPSTVS